eukprot:TRINITY_DN3403_c0_g6_i2.p1 TRINITY_DN3403_c0_g6~~TRINITY_DN3403_c0_g6_i2.p1  ORF type:complete len:403 (+),score=51.52 TRINITY_DN3403_c0_g6_i2:116-1324(+)
MLGYIPITMSINDIKEENEPAPSKIDEFWDKLVLWNSVSMMGCSASGGTESEIKVNGFPCGILSGHAYSMLDLFKIKKDGGKGKSRLIRIRNPWGNKEWNGKWSDGSAQVKQNKERIRDHYKQVRKEVCFTKYHVKMGTIEKWAEDPIDDGDFFMCYKDWREIFGSMYVCRDFFQDNEYYAVRFGYSWTEENNGGTPINGTQEEFEEWGKNPQAKISVKESSVTLFLCVSKEDERMEERKTYPSKQNLWTFNILECEGQLQTSVPVYVLKLIYSFDPNKLRLRSCLNIARDVTGMFTLVPGNYVLVPSTKERGVEGSYWITFFCPNSTSAKVTFDFSEPDVKREDLPKRLSDPYELCDETLRNFVQKRKKYFLYTQVIDRGSRDASFALENSQNRTKSRAQV